MRRRRLLGAALSAAAGGVGGGVLAGCGTGSPRPDGVLLDYLSLAWQKESVQVNKALVAEWNRAHPHSRVRYVQGSWDTVHDQLLTSFEGGSAPDVIHDEAGDLTDFAYGGYLADLRGLLPRALREEIPDRLWRTTTFRGGVHGVPILQEPRVLVANRKLLERAGAPPPDAGAPWTWERFEEMARRLSGEARGGGLRSRYGVAWALKEPVAQSLNLALTTGGRVFYREGGRNVVRFGARDAAVPELIRRQLRQDRTAAPGTLGMSGSDVLPGFFAGRYAMVPLNLSYRQQVRQQAPKGFDWVTLPLPRGEAASGGGTEQGISPQTLSVAQDCAHKEAAMAFIAFLARPGPLARLAKGDWILPTGETALRDPALRTRAHGWRTGALSAPDLVASPSLGVRGYPEWLDKVATPAFQEFYNGGTDVAGLRERLVGDGNRVLARYQR
ncbi:ABC transporter substrate-binding protein [Streptomyces daliensis]|uniref:Extracellular solute-binding protein n=1 Tax=Streptomyces daliensis TaxID=299421 RepID=A0A8T4IWN2_9ACTN|nr:extracellular solute-binding protein [Streptomyces daliensis]